MLDKGVSNKEFASILADADQEHLTDEQIDALLETSIEPGQDNNSKKEDNDEDMEESDKDKSSLT